MFLSFAVGGPADDSTAAGAGVEKVTAANAPSGKNSLGLDIEWVLRSFMSVGVSELDVGQTMLVISQLCKWELHRETSSSSWTLVRQTFGLGRRTAFRRQAEVV